MNSVFFGNVPEDNNNMKGSITPVADSKEASSLKDNGIYFLSGGFNYSTSHDIVSWILESNFKKNRSYDHLTLIINSHGGEVPSAFAIIDAMQGSKLPVHTVGLGCIASCGLLTFIAGAKGHRTLTPNTSILSHQWAWGSSGKEHELIAVVREYELTSRRIMNHYIKHTGLNEETIKSKLLPAHDIWLSGEEAKVLNICDNIKDL